MFILMTPSVENDSNVAFSIYDDDTNIGVRSGSVDIAVRKLNAAIGLLEPWFQKWRMRINAKKKSTITQFSKRLRHYRHSTQPVKFFNENIDLSKETKYLLIALDLKLTYRTHISCILRKANYRLRQLFTILNKSCTIDKNLALIIYKSLLRFIVSYASPAWSYAAKTHINKLQTFQNKVFRIITKLPRVMPLSLLVR
jgi:hypothetical protein